MYNFLLNIAFTLIAKLALFAIDTVFSFYWLKEKVQLIYKPKSLNIKYVDYKYMETSNN